MFRLLIALSFLLLFFSSCQKQVVWKSLSDDPSLSAWEVKSGTADYQMKDGVIIGTTKAGTPNTFLCTKEIYGDFILTYDVWVDPAINSGVQIRSEINKKGRVFGYQVELDPTERAYSGGIYDEGRRAWLYPMSRNDNARTAFKNGAWNHFRVEAIGNHIYTWVNDVPAAHIIDDLTSEGIIGLQVHSIYKDEDVGKEIKWKNIKILTDQFDRASYIESHNAQAISFLANELSNYEIEDGWQMLWNGKNFEGWKNDSNWEVNNGTLKSIDDQINNFVDLETLQSFDNFILELEFKLDSSTHAEIVYKMEPDFLVYNLTSVKQDDKFILAGLANEVAPVNLSIENRGVQYKGDNNWNQLRIIRRSKNFEHWLNGEKVLDESFDIEYKTSPIRITNTGHKIGLRNIKIKELH